MLFFLTPMRMLLLVLETARDVCCCCCCCCRLRVVCGVFAVKYLLLPWQWGLKHYWDQLLDADLESDALGWQYLSGCMVGKCTCRSCLACVAVEQQCVLLLGCGNATCAIVVALAV
jgi:hypothetical protein